MNPENQSNPVEKTLFGRVVKSTSCEIPSSLSESRKKRLREILSHSEKSYPLFRRVYAEKVSPRQAIKAKCLDCTCWQRAEITNCTVETCPLHDFRPFQKGDEDESEDQPASVA